MPARRGPITCNNEIPTHQRNGAEPRLRAVFALLPVTRRTNGATYFALYQGGGIEAFAGVIGLRAEVGDDIFFNSGAHNNLRMTFGPQFRF
jgi:hypothetical protein